MVLSRSAASVLLLAACFATGIAGGHWIALHTAAPSASPANAGDAAVATSVAESAGTADPTSTNTAATAAVTAPARTLPLPPRSEPIAAYYDELLAQARAGDGAAGRRLADDLYECANHSRRLDAVENLLDGGRGRGMRGGGGFAPAPGSGGPRSDGPRRNDPSFAERRLEVAERELQRVQETEKRCAGIEARQQVDPAELIRAAALAGDAQAQLCYALTPNDWKPDVLSPDWVQWSERWNQESPQMIRQAFENGLPEAAVVLSQMYTPWQPRDARPWNGRLGDDPYWAYAYNLVAQQWLGSPMQQRGGGNDFVARTAARLSSSQIAQAEAWAAAAGQRIRFQPRPAPGPGMDSICDRVRRAAGFR
ncbi:hypothetical protein DFR29_103195 [Tahibacter aquaticus]|uniref:Uncharacterized protein n=1 Tax=Tahibacter aquaticus TaxID=520092 RepID=A0A4R6Z526_9GAMM|nr:hypothetical protein [Tahibacter aquaticus]TDR46659.1 hypothetical protein DFR29_103195 [Tahibacter aquaticus]